MKRKAKAHWEGTLKEGKGTLTTESGTLNNTNYNFKMRFEDEKGTNPEELLGAAHAGCFTMAVGAKLSTMGLNPKSLDTEATVTLENGSITGVLWLLQVVWMASVLLNLKPLQLIPVKIVLYQEL